MAAPDLSKVHPDALYRRSKNAVYASHGHQEYVIEQTGNMFYVRAWHGGSLPKHLKTTFLSFNQCEQELVRHLKSKDKWGKATYPDKYD